MGVTRVCVPCTHLKACGNSYFILHAINLQKTQKIIIKQKQMTNPIFIENCKTSNHGKSAARFENL